MKHHPRYKIPYSIFNHIFLKFNFLDPEKENIKEQNFCSNILPKIKKKVTKKKTFDQVKSTI